MGDNIHRINAFARIEKIKEKNCSIGNEKHGNKCLYYNTQQNIKALADSIKSVGSFGSTNKQKHHLILDKMSHF